MEDEFKAGDVVQLKSGGPKMTVEDVDRYGYPGDSETKAKCVWFEGTKKKEEVFRFATLTKVG
jgi:uncharacterized protein YodC (DUF2158 family)